MSEKAVGYTTIGGDLEGGLAVIANVPKTVVIALLERLQQRFALEGVRQTLATAPGPELAADQSAEEGQCGAFTQQQSSHLFMAEPEGQQRADLRRPSFHAELELCVGFSSASSA